MPDFQQQGNMDQALMSNYGALMASNPQRAPQRQQTPRQQAQMQSRGYDPNAAYPNLAKWVSGMGTETVDYGGQTKLEQFHPGIDIGAPEGTPVQSPIQGTVTEAQTGHVHGEPHSFGNYVVVTDAQGNKHRFSHLSQEWVKIGDTVNPGQQFAAIGSTGSTYSASGIGTGPHLDYRITNAYNKYVNPHSYYGS